MRHGLVLFASDRGITPAASARAAEERGFDTFYVPEHTHVPVRREAAHPGTGDASLPDDRRDGDPALHLLVARKPTPDQLQEWYAAEPSEMVWGPPDGEESAVLAAMDRLAGRIGLG